MITPRRREDGRGSLVQRIGARSTRWTTYQHLPVKWCPFFVAFIIFLNLSFLLSFPPFFRSFFLSLFLSSFFLSSILCETLHKLNRSCIFIFTLSIPFPPFLLYLNPAPSLFPPKGHLNYNSTFYFIQVSEGKIP